MRVWRLTRAPFASLPFSGEGAARGGGRWNNRGVRVAYAAPSRSLAQLEILVHVGRAQAPSDYVFVEAELPDEAVTAISLRSLPVDWQSEPPPSTLRAIGDDWVRSRASLALRVPSVLVPEEDNVLINPGHPDIARLRIVGRPVAVIFDPRLFA